MNDAGYLGGIVLMLVGLVMMVLAAVWPQPRPER